MQEKPILWTDKKRPFLGLPLSFTRYTLTEEKLMISSGFFNKREEEIRLYRIEDVTLNRTLGERICGVGTIQTTRTVPPASSSETERQQLSLSAPTSFTQAGWAPTEQVQSSFTQRLSTPTVPLPPRISSLSTMKPTPV